MQSNTQKITFVLPKATVSLIQHFKREKHLKSASEVIVLAIKKMEKEEEIKKWSNGFELAAKDKQFQKEQFEIAEWGVSDGID
ncbi:hypothetical protein CQA49_07240 [Helicobacter sp. MIT 00-7814]|uniref:hypothetical protein n=1 Tax=unclassified Helicobacter TaxID=2593540 RepID=UPI000E1E779A|nr:MULTISPECIES: hypothetical protein [unclassified Helicobacter]RDU52704.1 hypothetical protein CQA37_08220 [Helicobacter sp. MIT 99-10781]RDU53138.1 hypothetical protein CQA49_07240 [Helicobacter sp. MIT 00-7814]